MGMSADRLRSSGLASVWMEFHHQAAKDAKDAKKMGCGARGPASFPKRGGPRFLGAFVSRMFPVIRVILGDERRAGDRLCLGPARPSPSLVPRPPLSSNPNSRMGHCKPAYERGPE